MELIKTFEKVNDLNLNYTVGPRRTGDISACWADTSKINSTIGWRAQKTVADALQDAWEWQNYLPPC